MRASSDFHLHPSVKWLAKPGESEKSATYFVADACIFFREDQAGPRVFVRRMLDDGAGGLSLPRMVTYEVYVKPDGHLFERAIDDAGKDSVRQLSRGDAFVSVETEGGNNRYLSKGFKYAQESDVRALWARQEQNIKERARQVADRSPAALKALEGAAMGAAVGRALVENGLAIAPKQGRGERGAAT